MANVVFEPKNACYEIMWVAKGDGYKGGDRLVSGSKSELKERMARGDKIGAIYNPVLIKGEMKLEELI